MKELHFLDDDGTFRMTGVGHDRGLAFGKSR